MNTTRMLFVAAVLCGLCLAQEIPVVPYDSLMEDRVSVDGYVDREENEYPAQLKSPATGLTVSWGFDDSMVYIALETRGRGWMAIGFCHRMTGSSDSLGAPGMDEANIIAGFCTDDSAEVYNVVGKDHAHEVAGHADSFDLEWEVDYDDETRVTTLEFAYPLKWQGEGAPAAFAGNEALKHAAIPGLEPGDTYDLILAQNTKSVSLRDKHTHRTRLKFRLAENPRRPAPSEGDK